MRLQAKTALLWGTAMMLGVSGVSLDAHARNTITAPGGCSQEFKGSKSTIKTCQDCVRGGGRYKQNVRTKVWACEAGSGGGSSSEPSGDMGPKGRGEGAPKTPPKTLSKHYSDYALIPAGTFTIGSPEREESRQPYEFQAKVTITRPFFMKTTEVTQGEWHTIMREASRSYLKDCGLDCPVAEVTWEQALAYLNKISEREKLEPCYDLSGKLATWTKGLDCAGYRLPTEAEWEYAARAGNTSARYGELDEIAWHKGNAGGRPKPVGQKKPNAFGLYDMLGNMNEWTWDAYRYGAFSPENGDARTDPITGGLKQEAFDPYAQPRTGERIVRGGSFGESPVYSRAAHRFQLIATAENWNIGFRPVRTKK